LRRGRTQEASPTVKDMWEARDYPLLNAVAKAEEDGRRLRHLSDLYGTGGLSEREVVAGIRALFQDGLITGIDVSGNDGFDLLEIELTGDGRREVEQWPANASYAELIRLLEERIAATEDPTERNRLRTFLGAVRDLGVSTGGSLLAALLRGQGG
jgi:DNA-binding Lrp family transcriptional regulator